MQVTDSATRLALLKQLSNIDVEHVNELFKETMAAAAGTTDKHGSL